MKKVIAIGLFSLFFLGLIIGLFYWLQTGAANPGGNSRSSVVTENLVSSGRITTTGGLVVHSGVVALPPSSIGASAYGNSSITGPKIAQQTIDVNNLTAGALNTLTDLSSQALAAIKTNVSQVLSVATQALSLAQQEVPAINEITQIIDQDLSLENLPAGAITAVKLADGLITTDKIADNSISASKILDGGIDSDTLAANSVTAAKVLDGSLTTNDLSNTAAITGSQIFDNTLTLSDLADGSVSSAKIIDGTLVGTDLADDSISANKILEDAVGADHVAANTIGASHIIDGGLTTSDLSTSAGLTSSQILDGDLLGADLADGVITSTKITDGTILVSDIADSAVNAAKILDGTLTTSDIASGTITANNLAANAGITTSQILDNTLTTSDLSSSAGILLTQLASGGSGQIILANASGVPNYVSLDGDGALSNTGALTIAEGAITSLKILDGTITVDDLLDGTITGAKIASNTITNGNISSSAAIAGTKISPDFGSQNILTTGQLQLGSSGTAISKHLSTTASVATNNILAGVCGTLGTVTVTGAAVGDTAIASPTAVSSGIETASLLWNAYVSAANTVTIRACNPTILGINLLDTQTWRVDVWQH